MLKEQPLPCSKSQFPFHLLRVLTNPSYPVQKFCKEVVTWSCLRHPNVLPLLGVMMSGDKFVMVSDWMTNGNITEFVKVDATADRLKLVCLSSQTLVPLPLMITRSP